MAWTHGIWRPKGGGLALQKSVDHTARMEERTSGPLSAGVEHYRQWSSSPQRGGLISHRQPKIPFRWLGAEQLPPLQVVQVEAAGADTAGAA